MASCGAETGSQNRPPQPLLNLLAPTTEALPTPEHSNQTPPNITTIEASAVTDSILTIEANTLTDSVQMVDACTTTESVKPMELAAPQP